MLALLRELWGPSGIKTKQRAGPQEADRQRVMDNYVGEKSVVTSQPHADPTAH
jgi:hypothetical protein